MTEDINYVALHTAEKINLHPSWRRVSTRARHDTVRETLAPLDLDQKRFLLCSGDRDDLQVGKSCTNKTNIGNFFYIFFHLLFEEPQDEKRRRINTALYGGRCRSMEAEKAEDPEEPLPFRTQDERPPVNRPLWRRTSTPQGGGTRNRSEPRPADIATNFSIARLVNVNLSSKMERFLLFNDHGRRKDRRQSPRLL